MRCLLETLAFTYRVSVEQIEALKGITIPCLHIIGGGSQNRTLSQWTANALGRPVITGPVEGTTMGNLLVQTDGARAKWPIWRRSARSYANPATWKPSNRNRAMTGRKRTANSSRPPDRLLKRESCPTSQTCQTGRMEGKRGRISLREIRWHAGCVRSQLVPSTFIAPD